MNTNLQEAFGMEGICQQNAIRRRIDKEVRLGKSPVARSGLSPARRTPVSVLNVADPVPRGSSSLKPTWARAAWGGASGCGWLQKTQTGFPSHGGVCEHETLPVRPTCRSNATHAFFDTSSVCAAHAI